MAFLTDRILTPEKMDDPGVPVADLRSSFRFIRFVNRWLGGASAVVNHLRRWSHRWPKGETIRILDIATGCADIPIAIARWAATAGHQVHITGVDRHPSTLAIAAEQIAKTPSRQGGAASTRDVEAPNAPSPAQAPPASPRIQLVAADALKLPFAPNTFHYCVTSMFLHHLPDIQVLTVLRMMDRLSTRGIIWNDLTRSRLGYWNAKLVTLPLNDIVRFDGPVSVLAGFKRKEVLDIRERLSLHYTKHHRHLWHRFTLAGEK